MEVNSNKDIWGARLVLPIEPDTVKTGERKCEAFFIILEMNDLSCS